MLEKFIGDICSRTVEWGPGLIVAFIMLYGLYRLVNGIGLRIVAALEKPTSALTLQAQSMDKLTGSLQDYVSRDRSEHREIIILLKLISDRINSLEERQIDEPQKRTVPTHPGMDP